MSLFSLGLRLPGEPCGRFLLSIIVARNYDAYFALPSVNKSAGIVESSINLIKQVGKLLKKSDDQKNKLFKEQ